MKQQRSYSFDSQYIDPADDREVAVDVEYDVEPEDRSVGIMSQTLTITSVKAGDVELMEKLAADQMETLTEAAYADLDRRQERNDDDYL